MLAFVQQVEVDFPCQLEHLNAFGWEFLMLHDIALLLPVHND